MKVPYSRPSIGYDEIASVVSTLRSGWLTSGPRVAEFEERFADYVGAENAIAVSSCTVGLEIVLAARGIGAGDEVIVPTLTFAATANAVVRTGARPVLVDVEDDLQISPVEVERAITSRTKAIVPVHFGGQAARLTELCRPGLRLIEDAAHAAGAYYGGQKVGRHGTAVFSFYPTKNMTTGEGGMVVTDDDVFAERIRRLIDHGRRDGEVVEAGWKATMPDVLAAIGMHQVKRLDELIARRQEIAHRYDAAFEGRPIGRRPRWLDPVRPNTYHLYPIEVENRDQVERELFLRGVETSFHYKPLHRQPAYRRRVLPRSGERAPFLVADRYAKHALSLPLYPAMTDEQVEYVIEQVIEALEPADVAA